MGSCLGSEKGKAAGRNLARKIKNELYICVYIRMRRFCHQSLSGDVCTLQLLLLVPGYYNTVSQSAAALAKKKEPKKTKKNSTASSLSLFLPFLSSTHPIFFTTLSSHSIFPKWPAVTLSLVKPSKLIRYEFNCVMRGVDFSNNAFHYSASFFLSFIPPRLTIKP